MNKTYCDISGTYPATPYQLVRSVQTGPNTQGTQLVIAIDLCDACANGLEDYIRKSKLLVDLAVVMKDGTVEVLPVTTPIT